MRGSPPVFFLLVGLLPTPIIQAAEVSHPPRLPLIMHPHELMSQQVVLSLANNLANGINDTFVQVPAPSTTSSPPPAAEGMRGRRRKKPEVSSQFHSSTSILMAGFQLPATFYYDATNRRTYYNYTIAVPYSPVMQWATYSLDDTMLLVDQTANVCRPVTGSNWTDLFSWVKYSRYGGEGVLEDGRECGLWNLTLPNKAHLGLCAQGDVPLYLRVESVGGGASNGTAALSPVFEAVFGVDYTPGPLPEEVFRAPSYCSSDALTVCSGGSSEVLTAYVFHPDGYYDIAGQDVADLLGDVYFFCNDIISNHTAIDQYSLVSQYALEVYTGWGQYQICNGYSPPLCFGLNDWYVGRESSFGAKEDLGGQCTDNQDIGSWFSLPVKGQCNDSSTATPLGPDTCTWRILKRIKTIDSRCMLDEWHGIRESCLSELSKGKVDATVKIFDAAFTYDEVARGGCPPIEQPR